MLLRGRRHISLPHLVYHVFFFNDTATTEIYTLSLHDALPIFAAILMPLSLVIFQLSVSRAKQLGTLRSEEHTSELQSRQYLVCRLLLEKKKKKKIGEPNVTKS